MQKNPTEIAINTIELKKIASAAKKNPYNETWEVRHNIECANERQALYIVPKITSGVVGVMLGLIAGNTGEYVRTQ